MNCYFTLNKTLKHAYILWLQSFVSISLRCLVHYNSPMGVYVDKEGKILVKYFLSQQRNNNKIENTYMTSEENSQ